MERIPRPGEIYQHFKGNLYRIVTLAEHSESGEQLVIYQALYGDYRVYARPLDMFMEKVDRSKYPQAQAEYRFTCLPLTDVAVSTQPAPGVLTEIGTQAAPDQPALSAPTAVSAPTDTSAPAAAFAQPASTVPTSEQAQPAAAPAQEPEEEFVLDPMLLAFLDADSYERKLEIFDSLHGRIDQSMLNTIAISLDLEVCEGDLEEQYLTLRNCMLTLEKYECNRLR